MAEPRKKVFYRRTIPVGNSSGVILPKALLGSDVRVVVVNPPRNIKKDVMSILEPVLEDILGAYVITKTKNKDSDEQGKKPKIEVLAISNKVNRHLEKRNYTIDVVPLPVLKKSIKEKSETREKLTKAKTIINRKLLIDLKRTI